MMNVEYDIRLITIEDYDVNIVKILIKHYVSIADLVKK